MSRAGTAGWESRTPELRSKSKIMREEEEKYDTGSNPVDGKAVSGAWADPRAGCGTCRGCRVLYHLQKTHEGDKAAESSKSGVVCCFPVLSDSTPCRDPAESERFLDRRTGHATFLFLSGGVEQLFRGPVEEPGPEHSAVRPSRIPSAGGDTDLPEVLGHISGGISPDCPDRARTAHAWQRRGGDG